MSNLSAMPSGQPILEVDKLSKVYRSGERQVTALRELSFTLAAGATCAITGPSGSGKTTLLGLCAGLDTPSSGRVLIDGNDLGALDEDGRAKVRNKLVGFVFQNYQLIPTLTALENVMVPLELQGAGSAQQLATELLDKVGLAERRTHYPLQLSGGEQQRVALARAFINSPKILFADEPTGNLDEDTSHGIVELLFNLNRASGTTLVIVTHNMELAARTERIISLRNGALVER
ncbi:MAG TPA: ABC transporter ATP-binding protein [Methylomirabilota bacterium]|nr:ABC transporter ATP-binding protein [Methylomirabilota bacterium]